MIPAANPDEDHLTATLCEMLDENLQELHALDYTYRQLCDDLSRPNMINSVSVTIQANKHTKTFEGKFSYADLGIVLEHHPPLRGKGATSAVLIQAKKLFRNNGQYTLNSRYESFDIEQLQRLVAVGCEDDKAPWTTCVYYLFFNPIRPLYASDAQSQLAYLDAERRGPYYVYDERAYRADYYSGFEKLYWSVYCDEKVVPDSELGVLLLDAGRMFCAYFTQTGKDDPITSWDRGNRIDKCLVRRSRKNHKPSLREIYGGEESFRAISFEDFFTFGLLQRGGCDNERLIKIASGFPPDPDDGRTMATRYSMRIRVESKVHFG